MKWLYWTIGILLGLLVLLTLAGAALPREDAFLAVGHYTQPPEAVWQTMTDYPAQPSWRGDLQRVEHLPDRNGHETWKLTEKGGTSVSLEVAQEVPPRRLVHRFADLPGGGSFTWNFVITPEEGGSRVTLTQRDSMPNPLFRLYFRLICGTKSADDYLANLGRKCGARASER